MNEDEDEDAVLGSPPPVPEELWERVSGAALSAPPGAADPTLLPDDVDAAADDPFGELDTGWDSGALRDGSGETGDGLADPGAQFSDGGPGDGDSPDVS